MCIVIDSDGKDKWIEIEKCDPDFLRCAPSKVIQRIREASFLLIILNCDDGFFCTTPMHQNFHATNDFTGIVLLDGMCIVIDSDGKDKWIEIEKCDQDFLRCAPSKVIQRIRGKNNAACSGGATCLTSGFFIGYGLGICTPPLKA
jgi:Na+-translocating ferredoxin:NAD+ oxidoreductase RnfC subunit